MTFSFWGFVWFFWRSTIGITRTVFSEIFFKCLVLLTSLDVWLHRHTVSELHHLVACSWTCSCSVPTFHMHSLISFGKCFLPPNFSKTFFHFQLHLKRCCYYCCCFWYYHCCHRILLFGCSYWFCFFFGRSLNLVSHDEYETFSLGYCSLQFLQCSDSHDIIKLLVVSVCFILLLNTERFECIKRTILEIFLLTLSFASAAEAITVNKEWHWVISSKWVEK